MARLTRRELLGGATAIGAIAVSGCISQPEDASGSSPGPGDSNDRTTDATGIDAASIETVETNCWTDDENPTEVAFGDEAVTVIGTLRASNPCHEAVFDSITVENDRLSVGVRLRTGDDTLCVECLGAISYEARIEPADPSRITTVTVNHGSGDETTITRYRDVRKRLPGRPNAFLRSIL